MDTHDPPPIIEPVPLPESAKPAGVGRQLPVPHYFTDTVRDLVKDLAGAIRSYVDDLSLRLHGTDARLTTLDTEMRADLRAARAEIATLREQLRLQGETLERIRTARPWLDRVLASGPR